MYRIEDTGVACQSVLCLFIVELLDCYCVLSLPFQHCCLWYFVYFSPSDFLVLAWIPVFRNMTNPNAALAVLHYGTLGFLPGGRDCVAFAQYQRR